MLSIDSKGGEFEQAIRESEKRLRPFRQTRRYFLAQYHGPYYGQAPSSARESKQREPLNAVFSTITVLLAHLCYQNPKVRITTEVAELRDEAKRIAEDMNHLLMEIEFAQAIRSVIRDALLGVGIVKTGLAPGRGVPDFQAEVGYLHDVGQPYCDPVDLDDYVIDPYARMREEAIWEGNAYRWPLEYIKRCGLFENTKSLHPRETRDRDRAESLSRGDMGESYRAEFREDVDLYDLWLPRDNAIVTVPHWDCAKEMVILRKVEADDPERGPYEMLGFHWVSSNAIPLSPVGIWFDLHVLQNVLADKAARQAERTKTVLAYVPQAAQDAEAIARTNDGQTVAVADVNLIKEITMGGTVQPLYEILAWVRQQLSEQAGNIDLIGGIRAKSETLGQDQMLMGQAGLRVEDMRGQLRDFLRKVLKKLAWYRWTDPMRARMIELKERGISMPFEMTQELQEGDFLDFNYDIEPYSMAARTPEQQYQRKLEWLTQIVLPLGQLGAPIGQYLNIGKLLEVTASDQDIAGADELILPGLPLGAGAMPEGAMGAEGGDQTVNISGQQAAVPEEMSGAGQGRGA